MRTRIRRVSGKWPPFGVHRSVPGQQQRDVCARLCHLAGGELDQIQFAAGTCRDSDGAADLSRGFDEFPEHVRRAFADTPVRSLDRVEVLRALRYAVEALLRERDEAGDLPATIEPRLREFIGVPRVDGIPHE